MWPGSLLRRVRPRCRVDKGVLTLKVSKKAEAARPMFKDIFVD